MISDHDLLQDRVRAPDAAESPARPPEGCPVVASRCSERFLDRVNLEFAREHLVISQGVAEQQGASAGPERLAYACAASRWPEVSHNVSVRLGTEVVGLEADAGEVAAAIDELSRLRVEAGRDAEEADEQAIEDDIDESDLDAILRAEEQDLLAVSGRGPVVRLTNALLFAALRSGASDMHVQLVQGGAGERQTVVRYRVDGVLHDARVLPEKLLGPVVSRVKVMCGLDIAERRLPQDGRSGVRIGRREIDLRVSTLPTAGGERLVVRLLDKGDASFFDLKQLGMPPDVCDAFQGLCARSHGMCLVTGPTGSGKTTTLYSALLGLATEQRNIITIEDPIEYELPGISQSQINTRKGVTFANGLRHILRQDPDVIMVGEIRDAETARTAIQSALTGHLVFSTLHTNDAASAVTRLVDLGVEPYLITSSLSGVLAQRLVRTVCGACAGRGCEACRHSGLKGRIGLYELLLIDGEIAELIADGATAGVIKRSARAAGMATLRERGEELLAEGRTVREEVDRVTLLSEPRVLAGGEEG